MAEQCERLRVQICYARADMQIIREIHLPVGTTVHAAILLSEILNETPEIDLAVSRVGIHGKLKTLETIVRDGDRIEIYRPLLADPKESRRKRAERKDLEKPAGR